MKNNVTKITEAVRSSLAEEVIVEDSDCAKPLEPEVLPQPAVQVEEKDPDSDGNN